MQLELIWKLEYENIGSFPVLSPGAMVLQFSCQPAGAPDGQTVKDGQFTKTIFS